jgi:hypothetical protein
MRGETTFRTEPQDGIDSFFKNQGNPYSRGSVEKCAQVFRANISAHIEWARMRLNGLGYCAKSRRDPHAALVRAA